MEKHLNPEWETFKMYALEFWSNPLGRLLLGTICALGVGQWLGSQI